MISHRFTSLNLSKGLHPYVVMSILLLSCQLEIIITFQNASNDDVFKHPYKFRTNQMDIEFQTILKLIREAG